MPEASRRTSRPIRFGIVLGAILSTVAGLACSDNAPSAVLVTIDRETFINVYVDLRRVALRKTSRNVSAAERDSVLTLHEVSEEDFRLFLDVNHAEADYMRDIWNEAEARISLMLRMADEGSQTND